MLKLNKGLICAALFFVLMLSPPWLKGDEEQIAIGVVLPLSGSVAYYGNESLDGARLAIEEINASGGVLGKKLFLIAMDDAGDAERALNVLIRLARDNVSFVMGSSTSSVTRAMAVQAQRRGIVLITPSATQHELTLTGDYIFRSCFTDPLQGTAGAEFAYKVLNSRRAALLYDAGLDYNTDLAASFRERFLSLGGTIAADETYLSGDVDFNVQIAHIRAVRPDVVYLPNFYNDVALQAQQLRARGVNCVLVGGDGWDGLVEEAGDEVVNAYWTSGFAADTTDPRGRAFAGAFEAQFKRSASQFAALGYDAIMLLADGMRAAGTFDPAAVKDAMAKIDGPYATGTIRFDENRNPVKDVTILQIVKKNGRLVNVYKIMVSTK
jgi:branched-chain amino acid transport system substrate-binding protein